MPLTEDQLKSQHSEQVLVLKQTIEEKDRILANYRHEHGRLELFFNDLKGLIEPVRAIEPIYDMPDKQEKTYFAAMQVSDPHMGATQESNEIEGFNEYNPEICERRQIDYAERVLKWIDKKRSIYRIDELSMLVTGDLISGDIHDELRVTNAFPVTVQIIRAAEVLTKQALILAPNFNRIKIEFIAADNHSRLTKKPQAKEEGLNSYNYLVGYIASMHLKSQPNIEFNLYPMHEKVVHVGPRQYLLTHGHGIRGWMGIPWYGVERRQSREAMARMQIIMDAIDLEMQKMKAIGFQKFIFGHFHFPINTPYYSCCGSVQGTDAYDHKNGRYADPSQSAWLIHPTLGEFDRTDFNLKYS